MKNKKRVLFISLIVAVFTLYFECLSSVIYKDIPSISIRTNFTFDYDVIQDNGVEDISYNSDGNANDNVYVYSTAKYEIESCEWESQDNNEFEIGGMPKVVVYLTAKDYPNTSSNNDYYYRFMSSYSSGSCYISNGSFVSAQRISTSSLKVVFKLKGIKGTYKQPENAYWEDDTGIARWDKANNCDSGYYDLVLYRNETKVLSVDKYHGTTYNFRPYFTKEGDYTYKIRTVPGTDVQAQYGKKSEYLDSTSLVVDSAKLYDGTSGSYYINEGIQVTTQQVGWIESNGNKYFVRPDGNMVKSNWMKWQNKWYYFGEDGAMKTGFFTQNDKQYYLSNDGSMLTGWMQSGNAYYYFNTSSGDDYGAMCIKTWVKYNGKYFYFDEAGVMVTGWRRITDNAGNTGYYYFYPNGTTNGLFGYMATNTTIDGFNIGSDGRWTQS